MQKFPLVAFKTQGKDEKWFTVTASWPIGLAFWLSVVIALWFLAATAIVFSIRYIF